MSIKECALACLGAGIVGLIVGVIFTGFYFSTALPQPGHARRVDASYGDTVRVIDWNWQVEEAAKAKEDHKKIRATFKEISKFCGGDDNVVQFYDGFYNFSCKDYSKVSDENLIKYRTK